jgi:CRP/FNR family cyclic AMP-dependent transcriptional regulator
VRIPALLASQPPEDVRRLMSAARRRSFAAGEVIFHEGDLADTLHFIQKGRVAASVTSVYGQELTLSIMGEDEFFGELALLRDDSVRSATIRALQDTETRSIHRDEFQALCKAHPEVNEVLVRILAARVLRLSSQLQEALHTSVDTRIRRRLIELAAVYGDGGAGTVIPLTQEQLAGLTGTARATVNRVLRQEESHGTVRLGRQRVTIVEPAGLARRAQSG